MRNATLKQLRSVAAILRTGRIVSAAKELNLTTPAITSQLKILEDGLGVSLFDRTQSGMRPTAAGWEVAINLPKISEEFYQSARWLRVYTAQRLAIDPNKVIRLATYTGAEVRGRLKDGESLLDW